MDSRNAHNIAAWNAYKATASVSMRQRSEASPHIPDWARWFNPEAYRPPPPPPQVNRFHHMSMENGEEGNTKVTRPSSKYIDSLDRVDLITELLMHNMVEVAERIFDLLGLRQTWLCRQVSSVWHEFITNHIFKRWAYQMAKGDPLLSEDLCHYMRIASDEAILGSTDNNPRRDRLFFGRICRNLENLRECWRKHEPKTQRINCESFVLSVYFTKDPKTLKPFVYCGLNNGDLQMWSISGQTHSKVRQMEVHSKGVKCIGVEGCVIVTGSYDCTAKVWYRSNWALIHKVTLHTDSVWDITIKPNLELEDEEECTNDDPKIVYTFATAGLDGAVGVFHITTDKNNTLGMRMSFLLQAHGDLVAAVDFDDKILVTGHEDSTVGIWDNRVRKKNEDPIPHRSIRILSGHSGGVTGVVINKNVLVSSSYDGTVRLWSLRNYSCLHIFEDPESLVRCLAFVGPMLACGDFGGSIHTWELDIESQPDNTKKSPKFTVRQHNKTKAHKGHVVCLQLTPTRIVSGSRDKTVLMQDFWLDDADYVKKKKSHQELTKEQERMLRRKAILDRSTGFSSLRRY